jgi:peptidoglycan/LPS O-acetylase OafA/YrhL
MDHLCRRRKLSSFNSDHRMQAYRDDIDGLRAICIVAVVMFHAGFGDWSGGYIGVDVFFVISGFLITSMIAREMNEGRFSLLGFYERRARRLLAATIPVIVFTTLFAWVFYTTDVFLAYAQSLLAFAAYVSNWYFLAVTGYFATSAETMPLLHTWSLAVEEQFYLIFPALLLLLGRRRSVVVPVLAVIAVLSLAYAQVELNAGNHDRAFFSLFSRFWELMAGALLALLANSLDRLARFAMPMRAAGVAMIVTAVFTFGPATNVPGLPTLLPVVGTLLVLAASPTVKDPVWHVLSAPPMTYLGRISYSLYLWHWPVIGAMRVLVLDRNDLHAVLAILASVAAASLSYHYLEQPVRKRRLLPKKIDMAGLAAGCFAVAASIGAYGWMSGGWPGRFDPEIEARAARAAMRPPDPDRCFKVGAVPNDFCTVGVKPGEPIDLVLWGDSHAASLIPAFRKYAEERGLSFAMTVRGDCLPLLGVWRTKDPTQVCRTFNEEALAFIKEHQARNIAIAARWQIYAAGPQRLLDEAHASPSKSADKAIFTAAIERTLAALPDRNILFVEPVPELRGELPAAYLLMHRIGLPPSQVAPTLKEHRKKARALGEALDDAGKSHRFSRFDPAAILCKGEELCAFEADGNLLYSDDDHLNLEGSLHLYPALAEALDAWRSKAHDAASMGTQP